MPVTVQLEVQHARSRRERQGGGGLKAHLLLDLHAVLSFQDQGDRLHDLLPMGAHDLVDVLPGAQATHTRGRSTMCGRGVKMYRTQTHYIVHQHLEAIYLYIYGVSVGLMNNMHVLGYIIIHISIGFVWGS